MRIPAWAKAVILLAMASVPAQAGPIDEARAAIAAKDYAAARGLLLMPGLRNDPVALDMLAGLTRDGLGAPADRIEAYMLYSLVFQSAAPDIAMKAADERLDMAKDMTLAEIRQGEARVVARIDADLGKEARLAQVEALREQLRACGPQGPDCEEVVWQVLPLGPAAADLVPELERLMTQDPMWMPRQLYSIAMAMIGTPAVPALCRILLDEEEIAAEGTWNAQLASNRIGVLGQGATEALPCMMKALSRDYVEIGLGRSESVTKLDAGVEALINDLRRQVARDMVWVGDPDEKVRYSMLFYFMSEPDVKTKITVGWAYGMMYADAGPVLAMLPPVLQGPDEEARLWALFTIVDMADREQFPAWAARLEPLVRPLLKSSDPEMSTIAQRALDLLAPHLPR